MARQAALFGILLATVMTVGCGAACGRLHAQITGMVVRSAAGEYVFFDSARARVDDHPLRSDLDPYSRVKTEEIVKTEISQVTCGEDFDYSVLMGPPLDSGKTVEGWVEEGRGRRSKSLYKSLSESEWSCPLGGPFYRLAESADGSWLFAWGRKPYIRTTWVSAASSGSAIAVEVKEDRQRVYFIQGDKITVCCLKTGKPVSWTTPMTFVTVTQELGGCKFEPPPDDTAALNTHMISADPEASTFWNDVKPIAEDAGWIE